MSWTQTLLSYPALAFSWLRHKKFTFEYFPLLLASRIIPGASQWAKIPKETAAAIKPSILALIREDVAAARTGIFPYSVYQTEPLRHHLRMAPKIWLETLMIVKRRWSQEKKKFTAEAQQFFSDVPVYFQRNYHFQKDGYLGKESAEYYEYQVELLFFGMADAMRRLMLRKLADHLGPTTESLHFVEIGAGTGRSTRFVKLAFPQARITVTDLSHPYLKVAQKKLAEFDRLDFIQCNGSDLPLKDNSVDVAYSVFLFHEIPQTERKRIIQESIRVVKPGGLIGILDSIQLGDQPQFDILLKHFPEDFHEPFYLHYISHPISELALELGLIPLSTTQGYVSKACWFRKPS